MSKRYGATVKMSAHLFQELIKVKGKILRVDIDPNYSETLTLTIEGDKDTYPEIASGSIPDECIVRHHVDKLGKIDQAVLENYRTGDKYVHYDKKENKTNGIEDITKHD